MLNKKWILLFLIIIFLFLGLFLSLILIILIFIFFISFILFNFKGIFKYLLLLSLFLILFYILTFPPIADYLLSKDLLFFNLSRYLILNSIKTNNKIYTKPIMKSINIFKINGYLNGIFRKFLRNKI